ncbi:helix-turn-helix domain-containing protein [Vibrio sp. FJH11]
MIYLKSSEFFSSSELPIATELRAPQSAYPEHAHSFEELIIVSGGSGTHVVNDVPMSLSKNYVCFVKREDRHLFENVNNLHLSNVLFDQTKLSVDSSLKKYIPTGPKEANGWFLNDASSLHVNQIIARLDKESHSLSPESSIICQSLFNLLLVELSRGKLFEISGDSSEEKVISIMSYLQQNYSEPNGLQELADKADISPKQLTNILNRLTGLNFNNYLNYVRASKALEELLYSEHSITDIAYRVGYQDANYFSTKFKKTFNVTPRDVRSGTKVQL